ncbi:flagellar basal body-associated FliL family protein [Aquifex aeolicus]|uniref:Flagellar protein FliL n=1 Tax=Aquifex aeolicus (strain VF5) TaxID=224324 RepID=FLIL_AQUAE|nr:flagellar basal body-associated protein FliL [Aquifex aeolicus]O67712.1 RecName: Full=Flagellar protein FliL [Aquifex aeolicus VF5]AAC07676.1 flagellar biosynthesis FliL [Aquifex aeolicus VF5]
MAEEVREEAQAGGGKKKLIFLLLLLILLAGAGAGAYFFLFAKKEEKKEEKAPKVAPPEVGIMYKLDPPFIVNLADPEATVYARISITLEVANQQVLQEVQKKEPVIRDAIIEIISSKTSNEIRTPEGREQLKLEVLKRINTILSEGGVRNVYFTEFVIQVE